MYIRISISAQSAASTPPAPDRMLTTASRSSYSPDSRVRTSMASMSSRSFVQLGVGLGSRCSGIRAFFFGGHFVEHRQVVDALAQFLDAAQFVLRVRQLAGDLLRVRLVVPQVGVGGFGLERLDAAAQTVDIEHPLHGRQRGVEGGDICKTVWIHDC